jgi:hypothetical protein
MDELNEHRREKPQAEGVLLTDFTALFESNLLD